MMIILDETKNTLNNIYAFCGKKNKNLILHKSWKLNIRILSPKFMSFNLKVPGSYCAKNEVFHYGFLQ